MTQLNHAEKKKENTLPSRATHSQYTQRATTSAFHGCALLNTTAFEHKVMGARRESPKLRPPHGFDCACFKGLLLHVAGRLRRNPGSYVSVRLVKQHGLEVSKQALEFGTLDR